MPAQKVARKSSRQKMARKNSRLVCCRQEDCDAEGGEVMQSKSRQKVARKSSRISMVRCSDGKQTLQDGDLGAGPHCDLDGKSLRILEFVIIFAVLCRAAL